MRHHPPRRRASLLAVITSLILIIGASGCSSDKSLKNPAEDWPAMADKIVAAAGSDEITAGETLVTYGLKLRIRTDTGEEWWEMPDPKSEPTTHPMNRVDLTGNAAITPAAIDWARLEGIAKQVTDCDLFRGAGFSILPGGQVLDYGMCQHYQPGTAAIDGEPRPDIFDISTADGIEEGLAWARRLSHDGKALLYSTLDFKQASIQGTVMDGVVTGDGSAPCYAQFRISDRDPGTIADNQLFFCAERSHLSEGRTETFDLNRITGEIVKDLETSLQAEAWWPRNKDSMFLIYAIDADTVEGRLVFLGPAQGPDKPTRITKQVTLPAA